MKPYIIVSVIWFGSCLATLIPTMSRVEIVQCFKLMDKLMDIMMLTTYNKNLLSPEENKQMVTACKTMICKVVQGIPTQLSENEQDGQDMGQVTNANLDSIIQSCRLQKSPADSARGGAGALARDVKENPTWKDEIDQQSLRGLTEPNQIIPQNIVQRLREMFESALNSSGNTIHFPPNTNYETTHVSERVGSVNHLNQENGESGKGLSRQNSQQSIDVDVDSIMNRNTDGNVNPPDEQEETNQRSPRSVIQSEEPINGNKIQRLCSTFGESPKRCRNYFQPNTNHEEPPSSKSGESVDQSNQGDGNDRQGRSGKYSQQLIDVDVNSTMNPKTNGNLNLNNEQEINHRSPRQLTQSKESIPTNNVQKLRKWYESSANASETQIESEAVTQ